MKESEIFNGVNGLRKQVESLNPIVCDFYFPAEYERRFLFYYF